MEKSKLEECIHCLLYEVGVTRLTPTNCDHDRNAFDCKAIRSQFFYRIDLSFCQNQMMCTSPEMYNTINID